MRKIFVPVASTLLLSPLTTFACNGSITCAMRQAPRQVMEMLPGFLSTHAGLLAGTAVGAVLVGVIRFRRIEAVQKNKR